MEIFNIGYNHRHDSSFFIDCPNGIGSWLFILTKTPAVFVIDDEEFVAKPYSFIIYKKGTPYYYRSHGDEYIDDWLYFNLNDDEEQLFTELNIPINKPKYIGNTTELTTFLWQITFEFFSPNIYKSDISEMYLKIFFMKLSGFINSNDYLKPGGLPFKHDLIVNIRANIYNLPNQIMSIDDMAAELGISRSGFQHMYKKYFGVSVIEDVINSRLKRAKYLLITTDYPLAIIAEHSGYNNEIHLIRQFKQKFGLSPTAYRKEASI